MPSFPLSRVEVKGGVERFAIAAGDPGPVRKGGTHAATSIKWRRTARRSEVQRIEERAYAGGLK